MVTAGAGVVGIVVGVGVGVAEDIGVVGAGVVEGAFEVQPLKAAIIAIIKIMSNVEKIFFPANQRPCVMFISPCPV